MIPSRVAAATDHATASSIEITGKWTCGDCEITTPTWPASGSGVGMVFDVLKTNMMVELYTFVGYSYTGYPAGYFKIMPRPGPLPSMSACVVLSECIADDARTLWCGIYLPRLPPLAAHPFGGDLTVHEAPTCTLS